MAEHMSDLTELSWRLIRPLLSISDQRSSENTKDIMNGIFFVLANDCRWQMLPYDFPDNREVYRYFKELRDKGVFVKIYEVLRKIVLSRVSSGKSLKVSCFEDRLVLSCMKHSAAELLETPDLIELKDYWLETGRFNRIFQLEDSIHRAVSNQEKSMVWVLIAIVYCLFHILDKNDSETDLNKKATSSKAESADLTNKRFLSSTTKRGHSNEN